MVVCLARIILNIEVLICVSKYLLELNDLVLFIAIVVVLLQTYK